jgi:hypothetical protein
VMWVMWNLTSFRLETLLVSVQDRCMITARRTVGKKLFWMHLMVPLGDEAQVEARFGLFGHSANVDARSVHYLRRTCHWLENSFGHTRWNSFVT